MSRATRAEHSHKESPQPSTCRSAQTAPCGFGRIDRELELPCEASQLDERARSPSSSSRPIYDAKVAVATSSHLAVRAMDHALATRSSSMASRAVDG